ncbi:MAG: hypothetical protein F6K26_08020 [Moorea sp. SIO2I5]|nr:hypothetical protein [Moorena sp. SIO2I5]
MPVSCLFPGGQDAHSTNIHSKTDATPAPHLPISRFPTPDSLLPIPYSHPSS